MYLTRDMEDVLKKCADEFECTVVFGPRQVGKSTMLQFFGADNYRVVTLDDLQNRALARNHPELFFKMFPPPVIVDEIQYAPDLCSYIKMMIDAQRMENLRTGASRKHLFYLTGSQQFVLQQSVSESLAGRVAVLHLNSFSDAEIAQNRGNVFNPDISQLLETQARYLENERLPVFTRIFRGGMPGIVCDNIDRDRFFTSYVETYLERDVRSLVGAGFETQFLSFMMVLASRTAQELNYSSIADDLNMDMRTIRRWISILETSGIIQLIYPYYPNISKRIIKSPKFYFMDTGLCTWLSRWPSAELCESGAMSGAFFETYVVSEMVKSFIHHGKTIEGTLYYYRDKDQRKVDLLYVTHDGIIPIEIKKNQTPHNADKHFSALDKYGTKRYPGVIICRTDRIVPLNADAYLVPEWLIGR